MTGDFEPSPHGKEAYANAYEVSLANKHVLYVLWTGQLAGVLCARSLHFEYYAWYFQTLPALLWLSPNLPDMPRVALWGMIEYAWNVNPPTFHSSLGLLILHCSLLGVLAFGVAPKALVAEGMGMGMTPPHVVGGEIRRRSAHEVYLELVRRNSQER